VKPPKNLSSLLIVSRSSARAVCLYMLENIHQDSFYNIFFYMDIIGYSVNAKLGPICLLIPLVSKLNYFLKGSDVLYKPVYEVGNIFLPAGCNFRDH
jgi:hypothetical protein